MKSVKTLMICFSLFILLCNLSSCEADKDDMTNEKIVNSTIQQEIQIKSGETLRIDLGNFGDEEGAWIFENPKNVKLSKLYRELISSSVFYEYCPFDNFVGSDTVGLVLNRGSDGSSLGLHDTTRICIITN